MKSYKVLILKTAKSDLFEIVDYLSEYSSQTALKQYDKIIEQINILEYFPFMCEEYPVTILGYNYRKMVIDRYLVFYVVENNSVVIHRILDARVNLPSFIEN